MRLHARWQGRHLSDKPVLVWLHGFLGSGREWQPVQNFFSDWPQLSIDLPGHGGSRAQQVSGFKQLSTRLSLTLRHHRVARYWLIGYSLGGRVALYHACHGADSALAGVVVEGAHFGLTSASERLQRLAEDRQWASLFCRRPLRETLDLWYRRPLFADLNEAQRNQLIALRSDNDPRALAAMLLSTSLAHQPCLLPAIRRLSAFHYLCGERDRKFQQLVTRAALPFTTLPTAGHNAHRACPQAFAAALAQKLNPVKET